MHKGIFKKTSDNKTCQIQQRTSLEGRCFAYSWLYRGKLKPLGSTQSGKELGDIRIKCCNVTMNMLWHIIHFKINKIYTKSQTSAMWRDEGIVDQGQFVLRTRDASIFTGTKVSKKSFTIIRQPFPLPQHPKVLNVSPILMCDKQRTLLEIRHWHLQCLWATTQTPPLGQG